MTSIEWMDKIIQQCEKIEAIVDEMKLEMVNEQKRRKTEEVILKRAKNQLILM